jgi:hypothetical protein
MKTYMTNGQLAYANLTRLVTMDAISAALDRASLHERNAVRMILLQNVLTGRVSGLVRHQKPARLESWLRGYAARIHACFVSERLAWQTLTLQTGHDDEVLIDQLRRAAAGAYTAIGTGFPDQRVDVDELVNDAYLWMRAGGGLLKYPFDSTLAHWFRDCIFDSAERLFRPSSRCLPLCEESLGALPAATEDAERDSQLLAASALAARLIDDDQRVIRDFVAGVDPAVTARALGVALSTLYARRKRIFAAMREILTA